MTLNKLKFAAFKAFVVLVPTYSVAYVSDKMVWVVPTLAAASFFAATIELSDQGTIKETSERLEDYEATTHYEPGSDGVGANYDGTV